jgi:hypothetical protein
VLKELGGGKYSMETLKRTLVLVLAAADFVVVALADAFCS